MKVITYSSPTNSMTKISLTANQVKALEDAGKWLRDHAGVEFCTVSHTWHEGQPTHTDAEIEEMLL